MTDNVDIVYAYGHAFVIVMKNNDNMSIFYISQNSSNHILDKITFKFQLCCGCRTKY